MSIKMTYHDGYWYVDVKATPAAPFKRYSRHPSLDEALEQTRLIALNNGVSV